MKYRLHMWPFILMAMFASCSPVESEHQSKSATKEYEIPIEKQIDLSDCLFQNETHYLVFFHSEKCGHCQQIIGDVLSFSEENIVKTYFLDIGKSINKMTYYPEQEITTNVSQIEELKIAGTPTLIDVKDGVVKDNIPGKESILTYLNKLRLDHKM